MQVRLFLIRCIEKKIKPFALIVPKRVDIILRVYNDKPAPGLIAVIDEPGLNEIHKFMVNPFSTKFLMDTQTAN